MSSLLPRLLPLRAPDRCARAVGVGALGLALILMGNVEGLGMTHAASEPLPPPVVRASDGLPAPTRRTARKMPRRTIPLIKRAKPARTQSRAAASKAAAKPIVRVAKPTPVTVRKRIVVPPPSRPIARLAKTARPAPSKSTASRSSLTRSTASKVHPASKAKATPPPRVRRVKNGGAKRKPQARTSRAVARKRTAPKTSPKKTERDAEETKRDEKRVVLIPRGACEGDT